ncbi:MAG TPA: hypothetical protein VGM97_01970 [Steroidobacteraceae bacterium]|jgi:hypothetical protein
MLDGIGKDAGLSAAKTVADAAEHVGDKVSDAAQNVSQELGRDLADAVSIMAGSLNRLESTLAAESAAWREELAAWRWQYAHTNDSLARLVAFVDRLSLAPRQ